jgi:predicted 2-oxoglutarate/Fe(II)-dependent dioxygenase YbiX/peroxiredoxin
MSEISPLNVGEPAPWFSAVGSNQGGVVMLDELAGRYIVLFFFGAAARPDVAEVLASVGERNDLFDYKHRLFVGISNDPEDFAQGRVRQCHPAQLILLDPGGAATRLYVSAPRPAGQVSAAIPPIAFVLSPSLQIVEIIEFGHVATFVERVESAMNEHSATSPAAHNAPVLVVPRVFDRSFCSQLIDLYEGSGGREIGSIENEGKAVEKFDTRFRRRLDWYISDETTVQRTRELLERRLLPMVYRVFQFRTTRIERYLIGCYNAEEGGYFRPHRDNTAPVVAHRRFAVSINLNEDYEGGNLRFPEFGYQSVRAAAGDAIVFSCSLLHEVTPVTKGRRFAFLSFFYDEPSHQMRDEYRRKWIEAQKPASG